MEGCWSLWRSWRRPHRGLSQEIRPLSLGCFACVHNVRKRGKAWRGALLELLVTEDPGIQYARMCDETAKHVRIVHRADRRYTILPTLKRVALQVLYGFPNPARTGRVFVCLKE